MEVRVEIFGDKQIARMFEELPKSVQTKIAKPLLDESASIAAGAMKSEAPQDTGLLRQALGTTAVKHYGNTLFVTAGVRRGFRRVVAPRRGGGSRLRRGISAESADKEMVRNPAKYLHLITIGRKAISARSAKVLYSAQADKFLGKRVAATSPDDFMSRAFDESQSQILSMITSKASDAVVTEAARLCH